MDKTYRTEIYRTFLINGLPAPLTPASSHLQLFDNYIDGTRIRLRSIRVPEEKKWTWILQQRFPENSNNFAVWKYAQIFLNEVEYQFFEQFEGREIRKNRYSHEFDKRGLEFDIYLGKLWGLILMNVYFETPEEMKEFTAPSYVICEVTGEKFFTGEHLVGKSFADVQDEFERLNAKK